MSFPPSKKTPLNSTSTQTDISSSTKIITTSTSTQTTPSKDIKLDRLKRIITTSIKLGASNFKIEHLQKDKETLQETITALQSKNRYLEKVTLKYNQIRKDYRRTSLKMHIKMETLQFTTNDSENKILYLYEELYSYSESLIGALTRSKKKKFTRNDIAKIAKLLTKDVPMLKEAFENTLIKIPHPSVIDINREFRLHTSPSKSSIYEFYPI